jgi:Di-haem cytochrome c peroxidase
VLGFPKFRPNYELTAGDFPLNGWLRPTERTPRGDDTQFLKEFANVSRDTNDVISSQGVRHTIFKGVTPGSAVDRGDPEPDIYNVVYPGLVEKRGLVRRAEARNAPTVINAVFNFDNFWDGRASFIFNGVNPFGFRDRASTLKQNVGGNLQDVFIRITNSSLASQAVGPTLSNFEMSFENRTFPDLGKKMVSLKPLAKQLVHPADSVLGPLALAHLQAGRPAGRPGLNAGTYADMIRAAFQDQWWNSTDIITRPPSTVAMQNASTNNPRTMARTHGYGQVTKGRTLLPTNLRADQYTQMQ